MAKQRRDKGDGSLRRRHNGTWEGRVTLTTPGGQTIHKSVYGKTQSETRQKLRDVQRKFNDINYIESHETTFGEWLDTWMQEYKRNSIKPSTYVGYQHSISKHIKPALGGIQLLDLRPEHIQKLLNDMGKPKGDAAGLDAWTITKAKNIINNSLEQAIRNRMLQFNPTRAVVPPKILQKDIRILMPEEQTTFVEALKGHRLEVLFVLALATGLRRGELMALTWDNIDLKNHSITVKGTVSRIKDPITGVTQLLYSEPKTKAGRRQVPLLESMISMLEQHRRRQEEEKRNAGSAWNPDDIVFCSNVGTYIEPRRINTTLDKITKSAGLEHLTFHALRHTFATRMLEANVPAKVVQEVLGHKDVTLTLNTYSHVIGSTAHDQMSKLDELFAKKNQVETDQKSQAKGKLEKKNSDPER